MTREDFLKELTKKLQSIHAKIQDAQALREDCEKFLKEHVGVGANDPISIESLATFVNNFMKMN